MSRVLFLSCLIAVPLSLFANERAGRESRESLCKHARMIIQLEVAAAKNITDCKAVGSPEQKVFQNASASVKWIADFRGKCPVKEFEIVGGPYVGDSPEQNYLAFQPGERFYLLLDAPLTPEVKTVVVTWRDRVCRLSEAQLNKIVASNKTFFDREAALHKKLDPKAFERAEEILRDIQAGKTIPPNALTKESYPALACLEVLLRNPDNPLEMKESARSSAPDKPSEDLSRYTTSGSYTRAQVLYDAMAIVVKQHNKEATEFNRRLIFDHLHEDLCLSGDFIKSYLADSTGESQLYKSVEMLKALADDTPDALWNKTLNGVEFKSLDPEIFVQFFKENPMDFADGDWGRAQLLLSMPHPLLKMYADQALEGEKNPSRLDRYLRFYADLQEWKTCVKIIDKYTALAIDAAPWKDYNPSRLASGLEEARKTLADYRDILKKSSCADEGALKKLAEIENKVKALEGKYTIQAKPAATPAPK